MSLSYTRQLPPAMRNANYIQPALDANAFNCPNCQVFAKQIWLYLQASSQPDGYGTQYQDKTFKVSRCENCQALTIWHGETIIFPITAHAEPPNADLPSDVAEDYNEARLIAGLSPRGAAALLRLSIQKLCKHLGLPGKNINSDIADLVVAGLPVKVQQALDSVRVIGNDAVHPGTIDLKDDRQTVNQLFRLVNFIGIKMLTEPREVEEIYNALPVEKRDAIARRDK